MLESDDEEGLVEEKCYTEETTTLKKRNQGSWSLLDFAKEAGDKKRRDLEVLSGQVLRRDLIKGAEFEIGDFVVKLEKRRVPNWKEVEPLTDISFMGMPTYIDNDGNIIMYNIALEYELNLMNDVINHFFRGLSEPQCDFKVGDPCLALFENDALFYRGIIVEMSEDECSVEFIDYGNTHRHITFDKIYSDVICWEIPPFAHKYRLFDSLAREDGQVNKKELEMLHQLTVDKILHVKVLLEDAENTDPSIIKRCWVTLNGTVIKTYQDFLAYANENCYEVEPSLCEA